MRNYYRLRYDDDPILRKSTEAVTEFGSIFLLDLTDNMMKIMLENSGIGIAAPQVGCLKKVVIVGNGKSAPTILCNPVIVNAYGSQKCMEGCLSFPDIFIETERPTRVKVEYQTVLGDRQILHSRDNILTLCIVHEIDHLNGILISDNKNFKKR